MRIIGPKGTENLTEVRRGILQMKELDGKFYKAGACCLTRLSAFILPILV